MGLAPTLVAEHSGLPSFGQLPILDTGSFVVRQTVTICNYIGRAAGTECRDVNEYTMSQMLMAEGEDLYNLMQRYQPTVFVKENSPGLSARSSS